MKSCTGIYIVVEFFSACTVYGMVCNCMVIFICLCIIILYLNNSCRSPKVLTAYKNIKNQKLVIL